MLIIGLTGSIGMGKSTTARFFREEGICVHDSDAAVHAIYKGEGSRGVEEVFPGVVVNGRVDRARLMGKVLNDSAAMRKLEDLVHPLVGRQRELFLQSAREALVPIVVLDIPLLFEIGSADAVDVIVVVSAPKEVQKSRVLARPGMTPERFEAILARQVSDSRKRSAAHFIVETQFGIDSARREVQAFLRALRWNAK